MSEKISIDDATEVGTFLSHCLMAALANVSTKSITDKMNIIPDEGVKTLDVCLTINGVEVKFSPFMKALQDQHERMLTERAQELMTERFGDFNTTLYDLEAKVKEAFYKSFSDSKENV